MTQITTLIPTGDPVLDTQQIKQALAQYNRVQLDGAGYTPFRVMETIVLNRAGQELVGIQPWSTVIEWCGDPSQACVFAIEQAQYVRLANMMIRPAYMDTPQEVACTGGDTIHLRGAPWSDGRWVCATLCAIENVWIHRMWNGIWVQGGGEHRLKRIQLRALRGSQGVRMFGTRPEEKLFRIIIEDIVADQGEVPNKHIKWIDFNSYSYSLRLDAAALMNGGYGVHMGDDLCTGDSYPMWIIANDVECDHCHLGGVHLAAGEGFQCGESWLGSSITGHGVACVDAWRGDFALSTTRLYGNALNGVHLAVGEVAVCDNVLVGDNSAWSPGQHAGVWLGPQVKDVRLSGFSGDCVGVVGNNQSYGLEIAQGAQRYAVTDLSTHGNLKGDILDHNAQPRSWWHRLMSFRCVLRQ